MGRIYIKVCMQKIKKYGFLQDIAYEYKHVMHYVQSTTFFYQNMLVRTQKKRDTKSPHRERTKAIMYL